MADNTAMSSQQRLYANIDNGALNNRWSEKPAAAGSSRKRWLVRTPKLYTL
jgi:hypothetical protein